MTDVQIPWVSTERFWNLVKASPDQCWNWPRCKNKKGYGLLSFCGKAVSAHRLAWKLSFGEIPKGLFVLHKCDNPSCCNPSHLFLGTDKDNMDDCVKKGRRKQTGETHRDAKLNAASVLNIRAQHRVGESQASLARKYNVSAGSIAQIVHLKKWKHVH